jgi:chemotaxis protein MotB
MRKRKPGAHENHERWLVSYADFMTLLFAFFVVMFASTQADKSKAKAVSESVKEALEAGQFSSAISVVLGRGKHEQAKKGIPTPDKDQAGTPSSGPQQHPADLVQSLATLQKGLENELKAGKVEVKLEQRGLVISLREAAFFGSGDDALAPSSIPILAKIASVVQGVPNPMRLEGFTDSIPIHNSRFRSNWELSAARAIAMQQALESRFQVPPSRMSVGGYAENAPADTNDTAEGRAHNRRVDVVLLSAQGSMAEPKSAQESKPSTAGAPAPQAQSAAPAAKH